MRSSTPIVISTKINYYHNEPQYDNNRMSNVDENDEVSQNMEDKHL